MKLGPGNLIIMRMNPCVVLTNTTDVYLDS